MKGGRAMMKGPSGVLTLLIHLKREWDGTGAMPQLRNCEDGVLSELRCGS
jgi:hypothetical protein